MAVTILDSAAFGGLYFPLQAIITAAQIALALDSCPSITRANKLSQKGGRNALFHVNSKNAVDLK